MPKLTISKEQEARFLYRSCGPTQVQFHHEIVLWLSLSILSFSSLQALYRSSFGTRGDWIYCALTSLWLSRHLLLRILYTSDRSTTRSPTLSGVLAHWMTSVAVAGQYFDRSDSHVVSRHVGIAHVEDVMNPTSALSLPSLAYTFHFVRVWLLEPVLRTLSAGSANFIQIPLSLWNSTKDSLSLSHPTLHRMAHFCPPAQLLLAASVFAACIFHLQPDSNHRRADAADALERFAISMQPSALQDGASGGNAGDSSFFEGPAAQGAYEALAPPSWTRVVLYMSCGATMLSILLYGRISFPLPDLVAGTNVLKALRNEARGTTGKPNKARVQKEQQESMWSEGYKSIVSENRFRLACKVALLRALDAIVCCALLPRTVYVCRATGHCTSDPTLSELRMILFPSGVAGPVRDDGVYESMFYAIKPDRAAAVLTILSVIVITAGVLLSQLVLLNKSYLAIMGHLAGEWKLVEENQENKGTASPWDPRRRYKKGDMIVCSYPGFRKSVYMATTNSPEGRPFDPFLRATHHLFQHELGHPVTSTIITRTAYLHGVFIAIIAVILLYYRWRSYPETAVMTILSANAMACYGILSTGMLDHEELEEVAKEINAS